jgi:hypothetical protein
METLTSEDGICVIYGWLYRQPFLMFNLFKNNNGMKQQFTSKNEKNQIAILIEYEYMYIKLVMFKNLNPVKLVFVC